jgi:hypothetical protein
LKRYNQRGEICVWRGGKKAIYACYYTSNIKKDWPWIMGMAATGEISHRKILIPETGGAIR